LVKKIIVNMAFLWATLDAKKGKKVATPINATGVNNPAQATPTNATIANDPAPTIPTVVSTSEASPWCLDTTTVPIQDGLESTTSHAAVEIIQTANNSSSVCLTPSNHNPAMTVPVLDSHATSMVASLSMQLETTPDIVGHPAVVLVTGVSLICATPLSQFKPPPDAVPGQPSLQSQPPTDLSLRGFARSPITLKNNGNYHASIQLTCEMSSQQQDNHHLSTRKTTLSHTQLLCFVAHGLDPVDVPLFIAGIEAIKMSNGQFPNYVPKFVREEINNLFCYPKKATPQDLHQIWVIV